MENKAQQSVARAPIDLIKEIDSSNLSAEEIDALLDQYPSDKRLMSALLQKPSFPQHHVLSILARMYPVELLRIAQAPRTAPFVRKRAETAFYERFRQMQKGEQITALKLMSPALLKQYVQVNDMQLLKAILDNPRCTEEVVVEMLHRKGMGSTLYLALMQSRWIMNLNVAEILAFDPQTPIRVLLLVIPVLPLGVIRRICRSPQLHHNVRMAAEKRLKVR